MKRVVSKSKPAIIRAWTEDDDKKITIQIENHAGDPLAFIRLSPDKASDLADSLAIYAAKLKMASRGKGSQRTALSGRPALLC
jgi:hypothetical protein